VVKVETIEGEDRYAIFDHVTVGIQLKGECGNLFLKVFAVQTKDI
jgi:hypothetical protein